MSIKIEIEAHPDRGDMKEQIERSMSALGYHRAAAAAMADAAHHGSGVVETKADGTAERVAPEDFRPAYSPEPEFEQGNPDDGTEPLDTRPVGSPSEGNKRRNSTEKAEDDAFEALAAEKGISIEKVNAAIAQAGRAEAKAQLSAMPGPSVNETPAISTGENRVGPEDDPETEAQDAVDEAAESERTGIAPIDELRRLIGQYSKKFGMQAAIKLHEEGGLIGKGIVDLDEAEIEAAMAAVTAALAEDGRAPEPKQEEKAEAAPKQATGDDLKAAMLRYVEKFGREAAEADGREIFTRLFGEGVTKFSQVPADGYGKAADAFDEAIEKNPFKR